MTSTPDRQPERRTRPSPHVWAARTRVFRRGESIGAGGQGFVDEATEEGFLERTVAVKSPNSELSDAVSARIVREAQIMAQLEHPGVIPVYDGGFDSRGRPFFVMARVRGMDLTQVIDAVHAPRTDRDDSEEWSLRRAVGVLLRVSDTLAFAHASGIIHRDVKPANIRVGTFGEVYLADWGLAKRVGEPVSSEPSDASAEMDQDAELEIALTQPETRGGTEPYVAPEQQHNLDRADARSDVYALGMVLRHLLIGAVPDRYPANFQAGRGLRVPGELKAICAKATQTDPDDRYADGSALQEDLRNFLDGRAVSAYRTNAFVVASKWWRRHHPWTSAICLLAILAVLAFAFESRRNTAELHRYIGVAQDSLERLTRVSSTRAVMNALGPFLETLSDASWSRPTRAAFLEAIGDAYVDQRWPTRGITTDGTRDAKALQLRRDLVDARTAIHRELPTAESHRNLGRALVRLGDLHRGPEKLRIYERAHAIFSELYAQPESSWDDADCLIWSEIRCTEPSNWKPALPQSEWPARAARGIERLRLANALARAMFVQDPHDPARRHTLCQVLRRRATLEQSKGEKNDGAKNDALTLLREAEVLSRDLHEYHSADRGYLQTRGEVLNTLAIALPEDSEEYREICEQMLSCWRQIASSNPAPATKHFLAKACEACAALFETSDPKRAAHLRRERANALAWLREHMDG